MRKVQQQKTETARLEVTVSKYDDIINEKRPALINRKPASMESRAAQFGAFRALTGYEEAVFETARYTEDKLILSDDAMNELDEKLRMLRSLIEEKPLITVTYFKPDDKKSGGVYLSFKERLVKIDEYEKKLKFNDKTEIPVNMISDIESELFEDLSI